MNRIKKSLIAVALLVLSFPIFANSTPQPGGSLIGLGYVFPADPNFPWHASQAAAVSADGSVVVGQSVDRNHIQAFRWTESGGMMALGFGYQSYATGVSADGRTLVGNYVDSKGDGAFRWTADTGFTKMEGNVRDVTAVSANGSAIAGSIFVDTKQLAGTSIVIPDHFRALRWTQAGGNIALGPMPGYEDDSAATGISWDGSVVVGWAGHRNYFCCGQDNYIETTQAFRWTQATGMVGIGTLPSYSRSIATGVSANGSVVVGNSSASGRFEEAFRWTQSGGMVGLGVLPGLKSSSANGVSGDGKVVVGTSTGYPIYKAFRWTAETGMQSVTDWLASAGISVPSNLPLAAATATNFNGSVVVGNTSAEGGSEQAWLARVGPAGSGLLTDMGLFNGSLAESNRQAALGVTDLSNLALFGAHHRSLLDSGQVRTQNGACAWTTVDAAGYDDSKTHAQLAEIGACKDLGPTRIGMGLGKAQASQNWSLGGRGKYDGHYLIAEVAGTFGDAMVGSLLGYRGDFDIDSRRNYMNGVSVDTSLADIDATATAARARLDWNDAVRLGHFSLSPYAIYDWTKTKLNAYTENGGGFRATFNASSWTTSEARVGMASKTMFSSSADLRFALEAVHRFKGESNPATGQVVDLISFALPGQKLKRNWARALIDVDYRLTDASTIALGANGASSGGDASWGLSAQYRHSF